MNYSRPRIEDLERLMAGWTVPEQAAFFQCVCSDSRRKEVVADYRLIEEAIEELFWAYNSKVRAGSQQALEKGMKATKRVWGKLLSQARVQDSVSELHEFAKPLSYEYLLRECCSALKIENSHSEDLNMLEVFLYETVVIRAVNAMTARERHQFIQRAIDIDVISTDFPSTGIKGSATTLAALSAAQASGFGVYLGASTALGFASHAIGVTLPFAVYTGITSTIAFAIGPVGFLAAGAWLGWSITGPEWSRIVRGLLHVIMLKAKAQSRRELLGAGAAL